MADYREMYLKLFQATTSAIDILQKAQQETEELYVTSTQPELQLIKGKSVSQKNGENIDTEEPTAHFVSDRPSSKK